MTDAGGEGDIRGGDHYKEVLVLVLGWKGGNTKNKAGEGEKLLIHTRSRREGGELCLFH